MNIKPCPKCNSEEVSIEGNGFCATITCEDCDYTRGGFSGREMLISIWNNESELNKKGDKNMKSDTYIKEALETLRTTEKRVDVMGFLSGVEALKLIAWTKDIIINHINDFSDSNERYISGLKNSEFQELLYSMCLIRYPELNDLRFKIYDSDTHLEINYKNSIK